MSYMYMIVGFVLVIFIMGGVSLLFMDTDSNESSESAFECGFSPISFSRVPFSMQFFSITIVFLIFDLEIVILLPLISSMELTLNYVWKLSFIVGLLILGLVVEWCDGSLDWSM
uniref:NADH dehydrogenase subunit 3 n=1 Tax=Eomenopon denticulatum TaxID=2965267 RepID=UPI0026E208C0|nr:NADH dehydrogenase subunit 3 [Eomenopon denticulatum]WIM51538.1 NADH dehydrogenase subunit 3 [Eomenopon denticulatum]